MPVIVRESIQKAAFSVSKGQRDLLHPLQLMYRLILCLQLVFIRVARAARELAEGFARIDTESGQIGAIGSGG